MPGTARTAGMTAAAMDGAATRTCTQADRAGPRPISASLISAMAATNRATSEAAAASSHKGRRRLFDIFRHHVGDDWQMVGVVSSRRIREALNERTPRPAIDAIEPQQRQPGWKRPEPRAGGKIAR